MNMAYTEHGFNRKLEREVAANQIKKTLKKANLKGNCKAYIFDKQFKYTLVVDRHKGNNRVVTVIIDPGSINIYGKNVVILTV